MSLGKGVDAEKIRLFSIPLVAIDVHPQVPPNIARVNPIKAITFHQMLPRVRDFAVASCRSSGQAPLTSDITRRRETIVFNSTSDDQEADRLSAGLGTCENMLFHKLIGVIRFGDPQTITNQWLQNTVREYTPQTQPVQPVRITPTSGGGGRCEDYGNIRCP